MMLSPRLYSGISLFMTVSVRIGVIPISWCPKLQLFQKCSKAKFRSHLNLFLFCLWNSFLFVQIFRFQQTKDYNSLNLVITFSAGILASMLCITLPVAFEDSFILEINSILTYLRRVQGKLNVKYKFVKYILFKLLNYILND